MRELYGPAGLPAPGSGTGRPCYIDHESSFPERECDGLHGPAATALIAAETNMVLSTVRTRLHEPLEPDVPPENSPTARNVGRAIGYLIAAIIVFTVVAVLAAGAWWIVTAVWGWLL